MGMLRRAIGQNNFYLKLWIAFLIILSGVGIFCAWQFINRSETATIPWGLLVPSYVFFSLVAAGSSLIGSFGTVFQVKRFQAVIKRGVWLSLVFLIPALLFIMLDLGKTSQALNLYLSFHGSSRLAWMGILYLIFGIALVVQLIVTLRENHLPKWSFLASGVFVLVAALVVETNLGALFGAVESKPLWNNAILPLHFIVTALLAGACVHILFTKISHWARKEPMQKSITSLFTVDYRSMLAALIIINFLVIAIKFIPEAMSTEAAPFVKLLVAGPYSFNFWGIEVVLGGFIPLAILLNNRSKSSVRWLTAAAVLILIGVFFSKYDLIIAGQSIGPTFTESFIPYFPSVYEIFTVIGGIALSLLVYTIGEKILPLNSMPEASSRSSFQSETNVKNKLAHQS